MKSININLYITRSISMFCWMYSGAKIGTTYMKVPVFQNVQNVMLFFFPWNQYFFWIPLGKQKRTLNWFCKLLFDSIHRLKTKWALLEGFSKRFQRTWLMWNIFEFIRYIRVKPSLELLLYLDCKVLILRPWGPFQQHELSLTPSWISNHTQ